MPSACPADRDAGYQIDKNNQFVIIIAIDKVQPIATSYGAQHAKPAEYPARCRRTAGPAGRAGRYDARGSEDDYTQAGNLYRLLSDQEKDNLTTNIANAMRSVSAEIKERQLMHFDKADPVYGASVRAKLNA